MSKAVILDIETYPNYTLYAFKKGKKVITFDLYGEKERWGKVEVKSIKKLLKNNLIITFNGMNYDIPMIDFAIQSKATVKQMYELSKRIITKRMRNWMIYRHTGVTALNINHIDIIEPSPAVKVSLKLYMARMGAKKIQDLPYDPDTMLTVKEAQEVKDYCGNDLIGTEMLYNAIKPRLNLRETLGATAKMDLRSKSDAQIAEALIVDSVGYTGKAPHLGSDYKVRYRVPKFLKFKSPELKRIKKALGHFEFELDKSGKPVLPKGFDSSITINKTTYKIGIGGLHSKEKSLTVTGGMENGDITSMYPQLIENQELYPEQLGRGFLVVFIKIKTERVEAKVQLGILKEGSKKYLIIEGIAGGYKIQLNGSFGKFGSKYSKLYSPDLLLQTTLTGQLVLLMLIEELEANGIRVVSANTDGVEVHCPDSKTSKLFRKIVKKQGIISSLNWEFGKYKSLHARDVNNYIANYGDHVKAKGVYAPRPKHPNKAGWLDLNVQTDICFKAVREYILNGTPLKKTINKCKDIKQFVSARRVNGGAMFGNNVPDLRPEGEWKPTKKYQKECDKLQALWVKDNGSYVGKVVRWYYSKQGSSIHYRLNGNKVPLTDGAKPMMELSEKIPKDLDYDWYYDYAQKMLDDLGGSKDDSTSK